MDPTLKKEEGFQFQTSQGMNGKTGVPGRRPISRMQCKPYDINLDEGFTAIKAQENKQAKTKNKQIRERERYTRKHSNTIAQYTHLYSTMIGYSEGIGRSGRRKTTTTKPTYSTASLEPPKVEIDTI